MTKKYIKSLHWSNATPEQIYEKLSEIINYLNNAIGVGLLPVPDGYREDWK